MFNVYSSSYAITQLASQKYNALLASQKTANVSQNKKVNPYKNAEPSKTVTAAKTESASTSVSTKEPVRIAVTDDPKTFENLSREQLAEILLNKNGFYNEVEVGNASGFLWKAHMEACDRVYYATRSAAAG